MNNNQILTLCDRLLLSLKLYNKKSILLPSTPGPPQGTFVRLRDTSNNHNSYTIPAVAASFLRLIQASIKDIGWFRGTALASLK